MTNFTIKEAKEDFNGNSKENIRIAYDQNNQYLGSGYIYVNLNTEVSPSHPLNIFIDINMHNEKDLGNEVSCELFRQLRIRAIEVRQYYKQYKARLYYGCSVEEQEKLKFFIARGFILDESTFLLEMNLKEYLFIDNTLERIIIKENDIKEFQLMDSIIDLHNRILFRPLDREEIEKFNRMLFAKQYTAYDNHEIIGHIMLYGKKDALGHLIGVVENLFVLKAWRNQKVATHLIDVSMRYFKAMNINKVQLEVWSINTAAYHFYRNLGFTVVMETEIYVGEYI